MQTKRERGHTYKKGKKTRNTDTHTHRQRPTNSGEHNKAPRDPTFSFAKEGNATGASNFFATISLTIEAKQFQTHPQYLRHYAPISHTAPHKGSASAMDGWSPLCTSCRSLPLQKERKKERKKSHPRRSTLQKIMTLRPTTQSYPTPSSVFHTLLHPHQNSPLNKIRIAKRQHGIFVSIHVGIWRSTVFCANCLREFHLPPTLTILGPAYT